MLACLKHPDRPTDQRACASAERDKVPDQVCLCCDECRAACLLIPHGHGGDPLGEWQIFWSPTRTIGTCVICGEDVSRWLTQPTG